MFGFPYGLSVDMVAMMWWDGRGPPLIQQAPLCAAPEEQFNSASVSKWN